MVRVGGMSYSCNPLAKAGQRIGEMRLHGRPIEADKTYKVASWAPVAEGARGEAIWDVLGQYLRDRKIVKPARLNLPRLIGVAGNLGIA
jgi:sulfur-oxidizing protein SoxB